MEEKKPDKKIDLNKIDLKKPEMKNSVKNLDTKAKITIAITAVMCIIFGVISGVVGAGVIYEADKLLRKQYDEQTWILPASCMIGIAAALMLSLFIAFRFGVLFSIF